MTLDFTPTFRRELKRLVKKYPSLLKDIKNLGEQVLEKSNIRHCIRSKHLQNSFVHNG